MGTIPGTSGSGKMTSSGHVVLQDVTVGVRMGRGSSPCRWGRDGGREGREGRKGREEREVEERTGKVGAGSSVCLQ